MKAKSYEDLDAQVERLYKTGRVNAKRHTVIRSITNVFESNISNSIGYMKEGRHVVDYYEKTVNYR